MVMSYWEGEVMGLGHEGSRRGLGRYVRELVKGTGSLVV